jgi:hypothetical protein
MAAYVPARVGASRVRWRWSPPLPPPRPPPTSSHHPCRHWLLALCTLPTPANSTHGFSISIAVRRKRPKANSSRERTLQQATGRRTQDKKIRIKNRRQLTIYQVPQNTRKIGARMPKLWSNQMILVTALCWYFPCHYGMYS